MRRLVIRRLEPTLRAFVLPVLAGLLSISSIPAAANEVEQRLREEYKNRIVVLRGFYPGDRLDYNADAAPSNAHSGDWTTDGLVLVGAIRISNLRLKMKAKRLTVVLGPKRTFKFMADNPKAQKKAPPLQIEVELPQVNPSAEQVDAILAKVFLTTQESFADIVPAYWKTCIAGGLNGRTSKCIFSPEFSAIPGFTAAPAADPNSEQAGDIPEHVDRRADFRPGSGTTPPRPVVQHEPEFSNPARQAKYQGTVTLKVVISHDGVPMNIRILTPLGCGLDEKAVQAVETWRFTPAEKSGQPIATEVVIQVDFHLY